MPSFQATTRKSPLPEGETAFYLQRLANGALCRGEVCLWCLSGWERANTSLEQLFGLIAEKSIWPELLAFSNFCWIWFFEKTSSDRREGKRTSFKAEGVKKKHKRNLLISPFSRIHGFGIDWPVSGTAGIEYPWSELRLGHRNDGIWELQGTFKILYTISFLLQMKK